MRETFRLGLLVMAPLFLLVGCGGGDWDKPGGPEGTMPDSAVSSFPNGEGRKMLSYANATKSDGKSTLVSTSNATGRDDLRNCTPTSSGSGNSADGDSDSIKAEYTTTFGASCSEDGTTVEMNGSVLERDHDDSRAFPAAGFSVSLKDVLMKISNAQFSVSVTAKGDYNINVNGSTINATLAALFDAEGSGSGRAASARYGHWTDATAVADDATDLKKSGKLSFVGYYRYEASGNGTEIKYTIEGRATDLVYNAVDCPSDRIKSGTATFKDGGSHTFEFTWTNCTLSVKHNGEAVTR